MKTSFMFLDIRYDPCDVSTHQAGSVDCRIFTQTSLEDCISTSNRAALEYLHMSLTEQDETNSTPSVMLQVTDTCVEAEPIESKPTSKRWKWIAGIAVGTGVAGVIAYVFKKN